MVSARGKNINISILQKCRDMSRSLGKWSSVNIWKFYYLVEQALLLTVISIAFENLGIAVIGFLGATASLFCARSLDGSYYKNMSVISAIIILALLLHYYGLIEKFNTPYYASDDIRFEYWGNYLYENGVYTINGLKKVYFSDQSNARLYPLILAWIQRITAGLGGFHTIMPRLLNGYLWLCTALITCRLYRNKKREKATEKKLFFSISLFPNALYISLFNYRDSWTVLFFMVSIYAITMIISGGPLRKQPLRSVFWVVALGICIIGLYYIRKSMILFLVVMVALIQMGKMQGRKAYNRIFFTFVIASFAIFFLFRVQAFSLFKTISSNYSDYLSNLISRGGLSNFIFRQPLLPFGFILRFIYGLCSPFPGEMLKLDYFSEPLYSIFRLAICIGTLYQIYYIPCIFRGLKKRNTDAWMYLLMFLGVILTTFTFRHFLMIIPFFFLTVFDCDEHERYMLGPYSRMCLIGGLSLCLVYLIL